MRSRSSLNIKVTSVKEREIKNRSHYLPTEGKKKIYEHPDRNNMPRTCPAAERTSRLTTKRSTFMRDDLFSKRRDLSVKDASPGSARTIFRICQSYIICLFSRVFSSNVIPKYTSDSPPSRRLEYQIFQISSNSH